MLKTPLNVTRTMSNGTTQYVGQLAGSKNGVFFQYHTDYCNSHPYSLSPFNLALNDELQKAPTEPHYGLHGVFADSLPDDWGLYLMDRVFRKQGIQPSQITALERLAYMGDRCLGALSYSPQLPFDEDHKNTSPNLIQLGQEAVKEFEGTESDLLEHLLNAGGSGGARPKLNVTQKEDGSYTTQPETEGKHCIVKLTSDKFYLGHNESLIEYLYLNIAQKAGIEVPEFSLLDANNGFFWLKQTRFDCVGTQGRYHMISACGLLDASFRMPSLDYVDLIKATRRMCGDKEAKKLVKRAVFNYLMCNQDDHAKNFAFLADDTDTWTLSPAYDLVYTPSSYQEHMTSFNGDGKRLNKKAVKALAQHAGFQNNQPLFDIADEIYTAAKTFGIEAKNLGVSPTFIKEITQKIDENMKNFG